MNIALWVVQVVLAVAFLGAGFLKATKPKDVLVERMAWVQDFSATTVKMIGVVEVLGAIGLVLPWATGIAPVLTPLAALGLAITMALAAVVHVRRKEMQVIPVNIVLMALALFVAVGRF